MISLLPRSTLFPYTTLFRSHFGFEGGIVQINVRDLVVGDGEDFARATIQNFPTEFVFNGQPTGAAEEPIEVDRLVGVRDRKSTRLNSSHQIISYAVFCLKKK